MALRSALFALIGLSLPAAAATPPNGGTVSVAAQPGEGAEALPPQLFVDAASQALAGKDFTLLEGADHAAYAVELRYRQSEVGTGSGKTASEGPKVINGGLTGGVGSRLSITMPSNKSQLVALERTELDMILRKRGEQEPLWRGTAVTVRPAGDPAGVAAALSNALLRAYPVQPEGPIGVP
ncbi:hypothetical protein [Sphingobium sp.]|uniref:hypothetical protein n=1 Tax=Sphingobium sp. TaxID=1912891 RepID=UPI002615F3D8|nr:hypothetical protein [Sphingobium sp.]